MLKNVNLIHFMNLTYVKWNKVLEVYYGILNKDITLIEEIKIDMSKKIGINCQFLLFQKKSNVEFFWNILCNIT